jgi:hypothetical protein
MVYKKWVDIIQYLFHFCEWTKHYQWVSIYPISSNI